MAEIALDKLKKPYTLDDIISAVKDVMDSSGMNGKLSSLPPASRILIKPNLVADLPAELGATTDPRVVLGICLVVSELGLSPIVAESSSIGIDTNMAFSLEYDILRSYGFDYYALDGRPIKNTCHGRLEVFEEVAKVKAVISVPKLKTHDQTIVTLGIKNLKGLLPDSSKASVHHNGLNLGIVQLYYAITHELGIPVYTVVDGLVGMEGLGPVYGTPKEMGLLIAGTEAPAVDAFCCELMGVSVEEVGYLKEIAGTGTECQVALVMCATKDSGVINGDEAVARYGASFTRAEHVLRELSVAGMFFDWPDACTACRNTITSVIAEHRINGETLPEVEYAAGKCCTFESRNGKPKIFVGNCAIRSLANMGGLHGCRYIVKGCPPLNDDLSEVLKELLDKEAGS